MRFFTTLYPAGRLEYFIVGVLLAIFSWVLFAFVLEVDFVQAEVAAGNFDSVSFNAGRASLALLGAVINLFLSVINVLRRLKDLAMGSIWALVVFVPLVGWIFQVYLLFASGVSRVTYTPYGNDPYDPNSWVPPEAPNHSGSTVSYQGQDIYLPGEEEGFGENQQAA